VCRGLEAEGLVVRSHVNGKIHNFIKNAERPEEAVAKPDSAQETEEKPWFWEGNVQNRVVGHLERMGYKIKSTANTLTKEKGKDIVAEGATGPLWVTVKGYPQETRKTNPTVQAGHWFKDAFFDIIDWRGESKYADLALALPDFSRYRKLAARVSYTQAMLDYSFIWVKEHGEVVVEERPEKGDISNGSE
jgi:hypothetical protein